VQSRLPFQFPEVRIRATLAYFVPRGGDNPRQICHCDSLDYMGKTDETRPSAVRWEIQSFGF
jgi:hypothetical protein